MFSYYGIAASVTIGIINYALLGFQFPVDGFYMHSFEIWLATTVVFFGSGNVGYTLLEYRLGHKPLVKGFIENVMWIPFLYVSYRLLNLLPNCSPAYVQFLLLWRALDPGISSSPCAPVLVRYYVERHH